MFCIGVYFKVFILSLFRDLYKEGSREGAPRIKFLQSMSLLLKTYAKKGMAMASEKSAWSRPWIFIT